jgi:hypothetical protein
VQILLIATEQGSLPIMPQLLRLPHCNETILGRNLRMLCELAGPGDSIMVVTTRPEICQAILPVPSGYDHRSDRWSIFRGPFRWHNWHAGPTDLAAHARARASFTVTARTVEVLVLSTLQLAGPLEAVSLGADVGSDPYDVLALQGNVVFSRTFLARLLGYPVHGEPGLTAGRMDPDTREIVGDAVAVRWCSLEGFWAKNDAVMAGARLREFLWSCQGRRLRTVRPPRVVYPDLGCFQDVTDWTLSIEGSTGLGELTRLDTLAVAEETEYQQAQVDVLAQPRA